MAINFSNELNVEIESHIVDCRSGVKYVGCTTGDSDVDGNDILVTLGWRQIEDRGARINMLMTLLMLKSIINILTFHKAVNALHHPSSTSI